MEESIKKIIHSETFTSLIVIIITFILCTNIFMSNKENSTNKKIGINSRKINIDILEDKILCEDVIVFNMIGQRKIDYRFIKDNDYLSNVKIYINNTESNSSEVYSVLPNGRIYLDLNSFLLKDLKISGNNITVKLTYELEKNYITRYSDKDVLSYFIDWENLSYFNNLTLNINSTETISNLTVDTTINDATVRQNKNKYSITMSNLNENSNINILFDINTKINNTINSEYINEKTVKENEKILKGKEEYSYIKEKIPSLITLAIISIVIFAISFKINRKEKINTYRRETLNLVPPIIAEAIIDGKIGLKELIMTTIIDLNVRGNIKIINNDILELVSLDNLEGYEREIIELLFKNNIIRLSDINNIFAKSNKETLAFTEKINNIKNLLLEKIFKMNIFSGELTIINKIIQLSAILISLNLPLIFLKDTNAFWQLILFVNIFIIVSYVKKNINKTTMQEEMIENSGGRSKHNAELIVLYIGIVCMIITSGIYVAKYYFVFFIITLLTFALNLYTAYQSQAAALTKNGKKEQAKLMELKKYINDYSLIRNRDLESVIIWDEYLAYATAFGIPNKVTDSIYEGWYNLNLNLQVVEKIFR